jgi:hypothetical protein
VPGTRSDSTSDRSVELRGVARRAVRLCSYCSCATTDCIVATYFAA